MKILGLTSQTTHVFGDLNQLQRWKPSSLTFLMMENKNPRCFTIQTVPKGLVVAGEWNLKVFQSASGFAEVLNAWFFL